MKSEKKYILILSILTAVLCACCFLPNIIAGTPLTYGTDLKPQQVFYVTEYNNLMNAFFQNGTLPFYSWHMFLGNNFYASMSFYGNGDLFNLLGLLLQNMNFFDRTELLEVLKLFIASYTMYALLKEIGYKPYVRIIGALCYAFSSWAIFFSGQSMFLSFYCLMPLYFLGIEKYFKNGSFWLFLVSVPLLAFTNWYFLYSVTVFTPIYCIFRFYLIHKNFKQFWKQIFKLIGVYFLGIGISMIYLLPTIFYTTGNNRLGELAGIFSFDSIEVYLHQLIAMFVPNYIYIYGNDIFETGWHVTREICLWASGLFGLLCVQSVFFKDKVFRNACRILFAILFVIMLVPVLDSFMHGMSDPSFRWLLIFIMMNVIIACHLLDNLSLLNMKALKISACIIAAVLAVYIPLSSVLTGKNLSEYIPQFILFVVCAAIILIYWFILSREMKHKILILLCTVCIELGAMSSALFISKLDTSSNGTYEFYDQVTHVLQDEDGELAEHLNSLDAENYSQYYRVYVPLYSLYWNYSHNMAIMYDINGLMTYESTYAPSWNKMVELEPSVKDQESTLIYRIEETDLIQFLNTKYAIVTQESELPEGINWQLVESNYRGSLYIYENTDYIEVGRSVNQIMKYSDYTDISAINSYALVNDDEYDEIAPLVTDASATLHDLYYGGNQLIGTITSDKDGFMVLTIPYDAGWKILINGQEVEYYDINGGFIGFAIPTGDSSYEMYFTPEGFKTGAVISVASLADVLIVFVLYRRKKH